LKANKQLVLLIMQLGSLCFSRIYFSSMEENHIEKIHIWCVIPFIKMFYLWLLNSGLVSIQRSQAKYSTKNGSIKFLTSFLLHFQL